MLSLPYHACVWAAAVTVSGAATVASSNSEPSVALAAGPLAGGLPSTPVRLRVEYMEAPLGVDVAYPLRFTWAANHPDRAQGQSAYQIVVTEQRRSGAVWDSGKVLSNHSQNVPLGGAVKLTADTAYSWSVRWWDRSGTPSPNASSTFSTGLYTEADWEGAGWIGGGTGQYRTPFHVKGPVVRATAYVIGLGYYTLHLNGNQVSSHELGAFTTFDRRVLYDTLDLTEHINEGLAGGKQVMGLVLGNGWYSLGATDPFDGGHPISIGPPVLRVRLTLRYADPSITTGNLISDTSWKHTPGPVTSSHIYKGTVYNATQETIGWTSPSFDDSSWTDAAVVAPPSEHVKLSSHAVMPQIRTTQSFTPCKMWQSSPGVYVFDFCQNMAGYATLRVSEGVAVQANVSISMLHAEAIHGPSQNNSKIFQHYGNGKYERNTYITRGDGAAVLWSPSFTYAGFRYVQLTGHPGTPDFNTLTAHFIHTDNEDVGSVSFSDSNLDAVQHITRASAMSNFQHVPTDCPQRERRGWLGDAQISAETNLYNFDMAASYTSFLASINDAQQHVCEFFNRSECEANGGYGTNGLNGSIPDVVPFYGHGRQQGDPAWGAAYTLLPDWLGSWHRDDQIFQQHYDGITAHLDQLIRVAKKNEADGLLTFGLYSDWCPPQGCGGFSAGSKEEDPSGLCPPTRVSNSKMVSSFYFIQQLRIVVRYASILGHDDDANRYSAVLAPLEGETGSFNKLFFDAGNATYREPNKNYGGALSVQTTISLAWQLRLIPAAHKAAVLQTLIDDIASHGYHLNVGIIGSKFLYPTLAEAGRNDVALMVSQQKTAPSYGYMVEQGATTLWETWYSTRYVPGGSPSNPKGTGGVPSWNHIMYGGGTSEYYFKHLAGIQQYPSSRGWERIMLKPAVWIPARNVSICANLTSATASLATSRGLIAASWACANTIPVAPVAPPVTKDSLCPPGSKLGGNVVEKWSADRKYEIGTLRLNCTDGGTMKAIAYASFGESTGNCASGFVRSPACGENGTLAAMVAACVGKSSCAVTASFLTFGDPCRDHVKSLAVVATGCQGVTSFAHPPAPTPTPTPVPAFTYDVVVPLGATADVHLPLMGLPDANVTESGEVLWKVGKLVPGVSGVLSAVADGARGALVVRVGSGSYGFAVAGA